MLESFLTPEAGIVTAGVYATLTLVKGITAGRLPKLREDVRFKRVALPVLAALVGAALSVAVHPTMLPTLSAQLVWGAVVGYFNTALYAQLKALFPGEQRLEQKLKDSIKPAELPINDRETIPGPPLTIDSEVPRAEERLP
jgi:hypothetical protein